MKKLIYTVGCALIVTSLQVFAENKPTDINYCAKGTDWKGAEYSTYTVRCSDGTKREISSWDKRKKWCIGKSQDRCTNDQLKTAKQACTEKD